MKLYHYSNNENILKEGLLSYIKHEDTKLINYLISLYDDDLYDRNNCLFLTFDKKDLGDILVSVDTELLNKDLLLVADQEIANDIFSNYYRGNDVEELVKKYTKSIIPFNDYKGEYKNPEILYQDDIPSSFLIIEEV